MVMKISLLCYLCRYSLRLDIHVVYRCSVSRWLNVSLSALNATNL